MGSRRILDFLIAKLGLKPGEENDTMSLNTSPCMGYCARSPNIRINDDHFIFGANVKNVLSDIEKGGKYVEPQILDLTDDFLNDLS